MNKTILGFINKCEGWKIAIKNLHWSSDNMSQHELCDDIADVISDFEDLVSEVEQSITGKVKLNSLNPKEIKIDGLKGFVEDVINDSKSFLSELENMGKNYIGIKAECEAFIGKMQRNLYLVNFTLKEELRSRLKDKLNESRPKNLANVDDAEIEKIRGRRPTSYEARKNQIYKITKIYGIGNGKYSDSSFDAVNLYIRAISSLAIVDDVEVYPCANLNKPEWDVQSDGGYTDYDPHDHMPRSKQYKITITYFDGMKVEGYIKCMAAGTVEHPFASYDTCMVLWPKENRVLENKYRGNQFRLSESELKNFLRKSVIESLRALNEEDFMDKREQEFLEKARRGLRQRDEEEFYRRHPEFRPTGGDVYENRKISLNRSGT